MNSDPKNNENSSIEDAAISPAQDSSQQFTWLWKDLLFILLSIAAILILGAAIFAAVFLARGESLDDLLQPTINQTLALAALESIALILGVYLFGLRRKNLTWDAVGIRSTSWTWIIISIVVTLIMIPIVSIVTLIVLFVSGQPLENPQLDFLLPEGLSALNAVLMLILAGIVAPFGEELLFRGVFYTFLRERWGIWLGVFVSSFAFGLLHGNLAVGLTGFLLGIVAALAFEYSKSLWTAVIVHAINNSLKIALLYLLILLGLEI